MLHSRVKKTDEPKTNLEVSKLITSVEICMKYQYILAKNEIIKVT